MIAVGAMLAVLVLAGGAFCLYLTVPHQRVLAVPLPSHAMRIVGFVGLAAALAILLALMGPATAVFSWTIGLMTAWTIPPVAIGWLHYRKQPRP